MSLTGGMIYLKYFIPKRAGIILRVAVVLLLVGVTINTFNKVENAKADAVYVNCSSVWSWYGGCTYDHTSYAPYVSTRPSSSQEYDSIHYPYWWDGAWHSSPTPKPSVSESAGENREQAVDIHDGTLPRIADDNPCAYHCPHAPLNDYRPETARPSSSQEYDSVRYPFWWDGAWHPSPTPKALESSN